MSYFVQDYSSCVMRTCKCCVVSKQCCSCAQCIKEWYYMYSTVCFVYYILVNRKSQGQNSSFIEFET